MRALLEDEDYTCNERALWTYLASNPPALFNPAGWVKQAHADEQVLAGEGSVRVQRGPDQARMARSSASGRSSVVCPRRTSPTSS